MELTNRKARSRQRGMSLIELMIASLVLMVGVLGCAALIPMAIGTNSKNRQQSNSTVIAQMTMERMMSLPVGTATSTITDCAGTASTINTAGSTAGTGATLLSSGAVDFSQTPGTAGAPAGYYLLYTTCGTAGRVSTYDVRWNIQTPSAYVKLVTVSAKLKGSNSNQVLFSLPVTIRSMVGGS
jgi:prepilin-type N-terminal cleavage/methylation domain-containing protein